MTKEKSRIPNLGHRANRENKREIETITVRVAKVDGSTTNKGIINSARR